MGRLHRLGLVSLPLLWALSSACSIVPGHRGGGKKELGVGLLAVVAGAYYAVDAREMFFGPGADASAPEEEELSLLAPGFVLPGGGHIRVERDRETIYEFTYERDPIAVLTEFHAHLEARGWASAQIKESKSLAFRVKRGRTTVLVLFSKDEQNRLVISAMRG
jgi:hypothetical protein